MHYFGITKNTIQLMFLFCLDVTKYIYKFPQEQYNYTTSILFMHERNPLPHVASKPHRN
jgi:hypothetical protein